MCLMGESWGDTKEVSLPKWVKKRLKDPATVEEPICHFTISVMTSLSLGELVVLIYDLGGRDLYLCLYTS